MITVVEAKLIADNHYRLRFHGLSTDTKPVGTYDNMIIGNGSSFLELDKKNVSFYDGAGKTWL